MNYESTGAIGICGTSDYQVSVYINYKYGIGSQVYVKKKAMRGIMQPVIVKKVNVKYTGDIYFDLDNAVWMESELIWFDEAQDMAIQYLESQIAANPCKA